MEKIETYKATTLVKKSKGQKTNEPAAHGTKCSANIGKGTAKGPNGINSQPGGRTRDHYTL
jgi:hypothetical protein